MCKLSVTDLCKQRHFTLSVPRNFWLEKQSFFLFQPPNSQTRDLCSESQTWTSIRDWCLHFHVLFWRWQWLPTYSRGFLFFFGVLPFPHAYTVANLAGEPDGEESFWPFFVLCDIQAKVRKFFSYFRVLVLDCIYINYYSVLTSQPMTRLSVMKLNIGRLEEILNWNTVENMKFVFPNLHNLALVFSCAPTSHLQESVLQSRWNYLKKKKKERKRWRPKTVWKLLFLKEKRKTKTNETFPQVTRTYLLLHNRSEGSTCTHLNWVIIAMTRNRCNFLRLRFTDQKTCSCERNTKDGQISHVLPAPHTLKTSWLQLAKNI